MRKLIICLGLAAAGCTTTAGMDLKLDGLVNRPVQAAIDRLGPPTGESDIPGGHSYFWIVDRDEQVQTVEAPNKFGIGAPVGMNDDGAAGATTYSQRCWISARRRAGRQGDRLSMVEARRRLRLLRGAPALSGRRVDPFSAG